VSRESADTEQLERRMSPPFAHRDTFDHIVRTESRLARIEEWQRGHEVLMKERFESLERTISAAVIEASHAAQQAAALLIAEERVAREFEREQRAKLIGKLNTATYVADVFSKVPQYVWPSLIGAVALITLAVVFRLQLPKEIMVLLK